MAIEEVTMFRTSDDSVFHTREAAHRHENRKAMVEDLASLIDREIPLVLRQQEIYACAGVIYDNWEHLKSIMGVRPTGD